MTRTQIIITVFGLFATLAAIFKATNRLYDLYHDYRYAKPLDDNPDTHLEALMTKNRFRAQLLRFFSYLTILALFLIPLVSQSGYRFLRTVLILFVLFAFATEEFYLDRARDRWLEDIRRSRRQNGQ